MLHGVRIFTKMFHQQVSPSWLNMIIRSMKNMRGYSFNYQQIGNCWNGKFSGQVQVLWPWNGQWAIVVDVSWKVTKVWKEHQSINQLQSLAHIASSKLSQLAMKHVPRKQMIDLVSIAMFVFLRPFSLSRCQQYPGQTVSACSRFLLKYRHQIYTTLYLLKNERNCGSHHR